MSFAPPSQLALPWRCIRTPTMPFFVAHLADVVVEGVCFLVLNLDLVAHAAGHVNQHRARSRSFIRGENIHHVHRAVPE